MKAWISLFIALLLGGGAWASQPGMDWVSWIRSGQTFQVVFDVAPSKFADHERVAPMSPMGTLKGGETYTVQFSEGGGWAVTGYNQGTGAPGTWTYRPGRPEDHDLDLWGRLYKFSDNGEVFDTQYGLVGHLVMAAAPPPPPPALPDPNLGNSVTPGGGAEPILWTTSANQYINRKGQNLRFICPPGGKSSDRLWGTGYYTEDSSICTAAVHAGLIGFASGGEVTVQIQPGANSYTGSTRNGLTSRDYGPWQGSFSFVGITPSTQPLFTTLPQGGINWTSSASAFRGKNGQRYAYHCPPGGRFGSVWGSGLYTDDSSVCTAAVHAGMLSQVHGGSVVIEIRPGAGSYSGSNRNGVGTANYGNWSGSFVLIGAQ